MINLKEELVFLLKQQEKNQRRIKEIVYDMFKDKLPASCTKHNIEWKKVLREELNYVV